METVLFVLLTAIVSTVTVVLVLKYAFHWVKVDNIPEKDIEEAAKKLMKEKFESAEQEIGEMKEKEENRIKQMRRESTEHEGLLIEREKKLKVNLL